MLGVLRALRARNGFNRFDPDRRAFAVSNEIVRKSDSLHWDEDCVDRLGSLAGVRGYPESVRGGGEGFSYQNRWSDRAGDGELHFAKY